MTGSLTAFARPARRAPALPVSLHGPGHPLCARLLRALLPVGLVLVGLVAAPAGASAAPLQERDAPPPASALEGESSPDPREQPLDQQIFEDQVSVSWLLVPVVVQDSRGRPVDDLTADHFSLAIDGRPAPIESVDRGRDAPLSVVVLQDLSGSMANGGKLEASQRAVSQLIDQARPGDELALATFAGERLQVDVPFTEEPSPLRESLAQWKGYGTTALHDAVSWLPDISSGGRSGNRIALLITDGLDNASTMDPEGARRLVRESQLPVYVLGLASGFKVRSATPQATGEVRYADLLATLAESTGGRYFEVTDRKELTEAIETLLEDLRQRYILAVAVRAGGPQTHHTLAVEVDRPGNRRYSWRARRGYVGGLPPSMVRSGAPGGAAAGTSGQP